MSFFDRLAKFADRVLTESVMPGMVQVDTDDHLYRSLTSSKRDLNPVEQDRMIELARYLYYRDPIGRRLIDIQAEWVLGEGISLTPVDETNKVLADVLNRFWNMPLNDWQRAGTQRFKDFRLYGEACWTVDEMPGTGTLVLSVVDPDMIHGVITDPGLIEQHTEVVVKSQLGGERKRLKVIRYDPRVDGFDDELEDGQSGKCFYFAINKVSSASRGTSDLFGLIDLIDGASQFVWTQLERARIANAMVFDVTVDGDDRDVTTEEKRIREKNVTRPGGVNVHTKNIVWQILSPEIGATEAEKMLQVVMRMVLGGAGLPEYMFADAGDTNRATAQEQSDPVTKRMTWVQNDWCAVLDKVLRYQYQRAAAKNPSLKTLKLEDAVPWRIVKPDISSKDMARLGAVFSQVVTAMAEAEANEYISRHTARTAVLNVAKLLGINSDPQTEAEMIATQDKPVQKDYERKPPAALIAAVEAANAQRSE